VEAVSQHVLDVVMLLGADDLIVLLFSAQTAAVELIAWNSGQQTVTVVVSRDDIWPTIFLGYVHLYFTTKW